MSQQTSSADTPQEHQPIVLGEVSNTQEHEPIVLGEVTNTQEHEPIVFGEVTNAQEHEPIVFGEVTNTQEHQPIVFGDVTNTQDGGALSSTPESADGALWSNRMEKSRALKRAWDALTPLAIEVGRRKGIETDEALRAIVETMYQDLKRRSGCRDKVKKQPLANRDMDRFGTVVFQNIQDSLRFLGQHVSKAPASNARQALLTSIVSVKTPTASLKRMFAGVREASFSQAKKRRTLAMESSDPGAWTTARKERKDKLENSSPNACQFIIGRVLEHTQPCAYKTRTLHDFSSSAFHSTNSDDGTGSLKCLAAGRCRTDPVHYLESTYEQLYELVMKELKQEFEREGSTVEVPTISGPVFMRLIPHNVEKSQDNARVCVCPYCKRAKLMAQSLLTNWPALHGGGHDGSCTCECHMCAGGACAKILPWTSGEAVRGMDDLADRLLCPMVPAFRSHRAGSGEDDVYMHRDECVKGTCLVCKGANLFDGCPRHLQGRGDNVSGEQTATRCTWQTFGPPVPEDRDQPLRSARRDDEKMDGHCDHVTDAAARKHTRLMSVKEHVGTPDGFRQAVKAETINFIQHLRVLRVQRKMFKEMRSSLRHGEVMLVLDVQEKITHQQQHQPQDEATGEISADVQTALFPVIAYFRVGDEVWSHSLAVLSDDLEQDSSWVQHTLEIITKEKLPEVLKKAGAQQPMHTLMIFSEDCPLRFKTSSNVCFIGGEDVADSEKGGAARLRIEWHFWPACHGREVSYNSVIEGETIKGVIEKNQSEGRWRESTSRALFDRCSTSELNFCVKVSSPEERAKFLGGDGQEPSGGKAQLVVAKANTLLGRSFLFVGKEDISPRKHAERSLKAAGRTNMFSFRATPTPGHVRAWRLSCRCPDCMVGDWHRCALLLRGILPLPTKVVDADVTADHLSMCERLARLLPYGSVAPIRVKPEDHGGAEIVPVLIGRKAPQCVDTRDSVDLDETPSAGDNTMVYVHDLVTVSNDDGTGRRGHFKLPPIVDYVKTRAVPLSAFVGVGRPPMQYLTRVPQTLESWELSATEVQKAKSMCLLMASRPAEAYVMDGTGEDVWDEEDIARAPVEVLSCYKKGQVVEAKVRVPKYLQAEIVSKQGKILSVEGGQSLIVGRIRKVEFLESQRRWCYKIRWERDDDQTRSSKKIANGLGLGSYLDEGQLDMWTVKDV